MNDFRRVILVDIDDHSRESVAKRLRAQGYEVELAPDAASGAGMALRAPPAAVIADLWMPSISGVQLCRLLHAEAATADVPVILRGESDDPRSRFWAVRAGAAAFVAKGRIGELVRALDDTVSVSTEAGFFLEIGGSAIDVHERIAQHLDAALFESVIAADVRALASCGSLDRLFDLFAQLFTQIHSYRWLAVHSFAPDRFALHHHPGHAETAEREARAALAIGAETSFFRIEDEDAQDHPAGPSVETRAVTFGGVEVGRVALASSPGGGLTGGPILDLVARELGGAIRMASLIEESQRIASTDLLTGLANRRAFGERAHREVALSARHGYPLSVLLFDVDHFKHINDRFGHGAGDRVLSTLGGVLRTQLRATDLAARWGGEEFVALLPSTDAEGGLVVAERLRAAIAELELKTDARDAIPVTASFGVATLREGDSVEVLIDRADRAMYAAKTGGRNRVVTLEEQEPLQEQHHSLVSSARPGARPSLRIVSG